MFLFLFFPLSFVQLISNMSQHPVMKQNLFCLRDKRLNKHSLQIEQSHENHYSSGQMVMLDYHHVELLKTISRYIDKLLLVIDS